MADDKTKLAVYSAMGRFHNSKDLTDFVITSNGETWHVHRLLLCMHSDVFAKWCTGEFEEAKKGQVDLSDHECKYIHALVEYLYTFNYKVSLDTTITEDLILHINMCIIADKERADPATTYNIEGLKSLAAAEFEYAADGGLRPDQLAAAVSEACDAPGATSAIRQIIVSEIISNQEYFLPDESTGESAELEEAISAYPEFALEIIKAKSSNQDYEERKWKEYQCPKCRGSFQAPYCSRDDVGYACRFCKASLDGESWQKHARP